MNKPIFRAELSTAVAGVVAIIEMLDIKSLRKEIAREWLPILEDGDCVRIFEEHRS
jgi:hypothetical protein